MRSSVPLLVVALLLVAFAGCNLNTDYFSDYRGKNLLGNSDFSTGKWSLVSDSNSANTTYNPTPTQFMNWTAASSDATLLSAYMNGPDGNAAYRLEILNLIPDGDFENTGNTGTSFYQSSLWNANPSTDVAWNTSGSDTNGVPFSISDRTLVFGNNSAADTLTLNIKNSVTAFSASLWSRPSAYQIHFDFYNASNGASLRVALTNPSQSSWDVSGLSPHSTTLYFFSQFFTTDSTSPNTILTIGHSGEFNYAYIDNVRLANASIDPSVILSFSSLSSGTAMLLPGTKSGAYSFSVYVRDDPTADQTGAAAAHLANRFYPSGLTVSVVAAVKSGSGTFSSFTARPSGGWTSWTKVTVPMGFDFYDSDSTLNGKPALTIRLSPTNTTTGGRDVGSLLVSEPVLNYNP